jgi:hypothetical protein
MIVAMVIVVQNQIFVLQTQNVFLIMKNNFRKMGVI